MSRSTLRRWAGPTALVCVLAILALTLTRLGEGPPGAAPGICALGLPCWLGHLVSFTALGVILAVWYAASDAAVRSPQRVLVMLLLALWLFGALDELAQGQLGRDTEFGDWAMDMVGALLGLLGGGALLRAIVRQ